ncbi:MAG: tyrosine-type recombinase/integrase [Clostridiales Family XIII bacterium]|jgi:site-specific recombinase XerD|nr:tyrosine-type recombinase/integrase [Clostridiales Family XIII bacterium]
MARELRVHNKSDRPDNVVMKEAVVEEKSEAVERELPNFLRGFFLYLRSSVLPMSRLAYLGDLRFFLRYLIDETDLTDAKETKDIKQADLARVKAVDVNIFLDYCRRYKVENEKGAIVYTNDNKSLARKRSSISVLFKYLYRDELVPKNITDGFDPIRLPKPGDREIKRLEDDEVVLMLDAVTNGTGLSDREKVFWQRTRLRDRAILILFVTYGLRISELRELNLSSFNFGRDEFRIFRKRGKEATLPLNNTARKALRAYIDAERSQTATLSADAPADADDVRQPTAANARAGDGDALFLSLRGGRITERQIRELVKKYTGIALGSGRGAGYSPHKLRATTASSLIERGNSIFDVQELLSHDNITTTQLYAAHRRNAKRELVKDMEWDEAR